MIVIGVDVHKHSLTAVAVDELGRALAERSGPVEGTVVAWARSLGADRLWAVEDCRHVTRGLEQTLLRSEEHTSELQSPCNLVCRLLLEKKKKEDKQRQRAKQMRS